MTSVAIAFTAESKRKRSTSSKVRNAIHETNFFELADEALAVRPYFWKVARNGLVAASCVQNRSQCEHFYDRLVKAHRRFADPDYQPFGLPSLRNDPDLWWFRGEFPEIFETKEV